MLSSGVDMYKFRFKNFCVVGSDCCVLIHGDVFFSGVPCAARGVPMYIFYPLAI